MSRRSSLPLDDENLLEEILLRLHPRPSSLLRASLVCKVWCRTLSDPRFLLRFRNHHQKPPLLGFFDRKHGRTPVFTAIASCRFTPRLPNLVDWTSWLPVFIGARHGAALQLVRARHEVLVWDPVTGVQQHVPFPPRLNNGSGCLVRGAAVLCTGTSDRVGQHMHDGCSLSPFTLILAGNIPKLAKAFACLCDSKSGVWGQVISTAATDLVFINRPGIMVGNSLCWLLSSGDILEFDFETQTLAVIPKPVDANATSVWSFQPLRTEDGGLGLAVLPMTKLSIQIWASKSNCDGVVSWVLQKTVQLDNQLSQPLFPGAGRVVAMMGYDEDTNVVFLCSESRHFMLRLDSMRFRFIIGTKRYRDFRMYYPYRKFYTAGRGIADGDGGAENVNT